MRMRRRMAAVGAVLAVALSTVGVAGTATAEVVEVRGAIHVPVTEAYEDPHCVTDAAGAAQQGVAGWTIDPVTPGNSFTLTAADLVGVADFDILFYASASDCAAGTAPVHRSNNAGDESGTVPEVATVALVVMWVGAPNSEFVYREGPPSGGEVELPATIEDPGPRETTVVAVIDYGFNPYHFDFVGHQHPWNVDTDTDNDLDFRVDPSSYVAGYPGATELPITIPTRPDQDVSTLHSGEDAAIWEGFEASTPEDPNMYWFPGTKVIGALSFGNAEFYAGNDSHGTRSAASAAGNLHGTCPECLFVLVNNATTEALDWVAAQSWIDVVTNSYGHSTVGGYVRDNIYFGAPVDATRAAAESGQTIVFSAGNGLANAFDVPMFTYWSSEKGPDWMVTVGAVDPSEEQTYSGAGKPVDISSYGSNYPSTGGSSATGTGTHSGTSNAAPTVAGTIARVIQMAREAFGDTVGGHADGVAASAPDGHDVAGEGRGNGRGEGRGKGKGGGKPGEAEGFCGDANPQCPLADGVLTAVEARQVVFENVLPSDLAVPLSVYPVWPSTEHAYYYQGHGVVYGRLDADRYAAEQQRFRDALIGAAAPIERPAHETTWMAVDSKCRQRLWGSWSGGYYDGATEPAPDPTADQLAFLFDSWCSAAPQDLFADQAG